MVASEPKAIRVYARMPNIQKTYTGVLEHASREGLAVSIDEEEKEVLFKTGASLFLTIQSSEAAYELMTQVQHQDGKRLKLRIISPPRRIDRRRNKRYRVNLPVRARVLSEQQTQDTESASWEVQAVDISRSGMRLIVPCELSVGTEVEVCFTLLNVEQPIRTKAEVRFARALNNGQWSIGVRFTELARTDAYWLVRLFP